MAELQKRADRADQLVLFFLAGANFWENLGKILVLIFFGGGGNSSGLIFTPFANMRYFRSKAKRTSWFRKKWTTLAFHILCHQLLFGTREGYRKLG